MGLCKRCRFDDANALCVQETIGWVSTDSAANRAIYEGSGLVPVYEGLVFLDLRGIGAETVILSACGGCQRGSLCQAPAERLAALPG